MAPGGLSSFCDDCGYQACLAQGDCLQTRGDAMGVDPQDLIHPSKVAQDLQRADLSQFVDLVRRLSAEELHELEQELLASHPDRPTNPAPRHE
ncbi:hypothetical protein [Brevundimonas naejangsanensis]|uniref:hypothetical protein n=1 Tax=Brevundimonas naejangsanensis TaxID=588932 RepID=UPI0026EE63A9|nr:hypothetical protein [Brevundimonas naejangsanensis]